MLVGTRDGYTSRLVRVDGWIVALRRARRHADLPAARSAYVLLNPRRRVDYIYFWLGQDEYLVVPQTALPQDRTTFVDSGGSKYQRFHNTFAAVLETGAGRAAKEPDGQAGPRQLS
jgi:hypothetical protein